MPGALYNYINHGCGVQDFPVDRDGWSRRVESQGSSQSTITQPLTTNEPRVKQSKFKETPENSAPRMRTHAEIRAAKLRREQKKKISAARVIQGHARKWLERNTIQILRRRLAEKEEESSKKHKENHELRVELQRVYRAVDASKKAIGCVKTLKQYQQISGLVEKALSKKRTSRWGLTKGERLVVAQKAVNKKY
jgi:hypothetical protein